MFPWPRQQTRLPRDSAVAGAGPGHVVLTLPLLERARMGEHPHQQRWGGPWLRAPPSPFCSFQLFIWIRCLLEGTERGSAYESASEWGWQLQEAVTTDLGVFLEAPPATRSLREKRKIALSEKRLVLKLAKLCAWLRFGG